MDRGQSLYEMNRPLDVWFSLFFHHFFEFGNWDVGFSHEIPEPLQMDKIQKIFLHNQIWLRIYHPKNIHIEPWSL